MFANTANKLMDLALGPREGSIERYPLERDFQASARLVLSIITYILD